MEVDKSIFRHTESSTSCVMHWIYRRAENLGDTMIYLGLQNYWASELVAFFHVKCIQCQKFGIGSVKVCPRQFSTSEVPFTLHH
jgi:hypothetical protein